MKAVILAGGEGTRLRPLTSNQPKPMLPMANRPMLEHIVRLLKEHGFDDIVVTVAFLANQIRNYFGDGSDFGVQMRYASEDSPLGTAGSVRNAAEELDDTFLVISGDVLTDIDLTEFVKAHREAGAFGSIALKRVEDPVEFGIVITRPDGSIDRFLEKPTWGQVFSDTINTGMYVLEPEVFDFIPEGEVVDFSSDVFPAILKRGKPLLGHVVEGYWEDVGTLDAYVRAHTDILDGRVRVDIDGFELADGVWLGEGADLDPSATVTGPVVIGDNARVEAGAQLQPYTVLGSDVVVKADAFIERSVVHDHGYIGPSVDLRGCVIGRSSDLRSHARVREGAVLGDECFVGEYALDQPRREGVPVQDGRGERRHQLVDRVGEPGHAHPLRAPRRERPRERRHHARAGGPPRDGLRQRAEEGLDGHHEPRHQPRRAGAQAVDHRRPQPRRGDRRRRRARDGAADPVPGEELARPGRDHGAAGPGRPEQREHPLLRGRRPRHRREHAAQDRAVAVARGLPARVRRRHRRHPLPAAVARVLHVGARGRRSTPTACGRPASRSCSTTRTARCRS